MSDRPNPLGKVAASVGVAWSAAGAVLSALAAWGVLSVATAHSAQVIGDALPDTIVALGTLIAAATPLITGILAAFRTVAHGKDYVTPLSSPRDTDGNALVPVGPAQGPVV